MTETIQFSPFLPVALIVVLVCLAVIVTLLRVRRHVLGTTLRLLTIALIGLFLLGPRLSDVEANDLADVVLVLEDQSRSLTFGARDQITNAAATRLTDALEAENIEVRRIPFGDRTRTDFGAALSNAIAEVPRDRLSAVVALTDGQLHDEATPPPSVPIHSLLAGDPTTQSDRRIEIVRAPRFGVVGENIELTLRARSNTETGAVSTTLLVNGQIHSQPMVEIGEDVTITVPLRQPGQTILELDIAEGTDELTLLNNKAVISLTAVRDRLRVLLVSGEPHAGERVWRNTLKSDPAVDLVHFTILKPGTKAAVAAQQELNLIEFPHEQLFLDKLNDFDVVIFDRYTYRGVLQPFEFEEIARYVENGGAILIAAGPEIATSSSLAARPNLSYILPALPSAEAINGEFIPALTDVGKRHPVTHSLGDPAEWGRWARYIPAIARSGETVMTASDGSPLLILSREREGRIAILMSDHIWLWAREFDGGGPYRELLRRLVHWLMQEPELEEESLSGQVQDGTLFVQRRTLATEISPVTITGPDGETRQIDLAPEEDDPGLFVAEVAVGEPGLYRLSSPGPGTDPLYALAHDGTTTARELEAVVTTTEKVNEIAEVSGGNVFILNDERTNLPPIRRVSANANNTPANALFLPRRDAREITSLTVRPFMPNWAWLILIAGAAIGAWLAEGRLRFGNRR